MTNVDGQDDPKITVFPTAKERQVLEKAHIMHPAEKPASEPVLNLPVLVRNLCLINVIIFAVMDIFPNLLTPDQVNALSFVPARYFNDEPIGFAALFSPFTYMFLHGGWLHLAINMGMLMAFGTGLERRMGARRMLLLYVVTGLLGALLQTIVQPHLEVPMIGASGAVSGLFGGIIMIMYGDGMMGQGYRKLLPFVAVWIGISLFFGLFGMPGTDSPIAWIPHVGGFIAGMLLYRPILRMRVQH